MQRRAFLRTGFSLAATAGLAFASGVKMVKLVEFTNSGKREGEIQVEKVVKTDEDWRKQLT
ncbi:MAG: hypothetical protein M3Y27_07560, partial [Acidobacteriota bacterium]|nr:hypothetical protein [Acidobacteriota bacterium]